VWDFCAWVFDCTVSAASAVGKSPFQTIKYIFILWIVGDVAARLETTGIRISIAIRIKQGQGGILFVLLDT